MSDQAQSSRDLRRQALIVEAAGQRRAVVTALAPLQRPLAYADLGLSAVRLVRSYPLWSLAGVGLVFSLRPSLVSAWLRRGMVTWQVVKAVRGALALPAPRVGQTGR